MADIQGTPTTSMDRTPSNVTACYYSEGLQPSSFLLLVMASEMASTLLAVDLDTGVQHTDLREDVMTHVTP